MRLTCRLVAVTSTAAILACSDATSPPRPAVTQKYYVLVSIDGNPVPANLSAGPADTLTVLDGALLLQTSDSAKEINHERDVAPGYPTSVFTDTLRRSYRIQGDSIEVGFFEGCRDLCIPNEVGRYDDSTLTLARDYSPGSTGPEYLYRLVADSSQ